MAPRLLIPLLGSWFLAAALHAQTTVPNKPQYQSPSVNARNVSKTTTLTLRPGGKLPGTSVPSSVFTVKGSLSGIHDGKVVVADDGKTLIFKPVEPFWSSEVVTVKLNAGLYNAAGNSLSGYEWHFSVALRSPDLFFHGGPTAEYFVPIDTAHQGKSNRKDDGMHLMMYGQLPADFPHLTLSKYVEPSEGEVYMSDFPFSADTSAAPYLMIIANPDTPSFFHRLPGRAFDFKRLSNGMMAYCDETTLCYYEMNDQHEIVDSFRCGNGYPTDVHELQMLPNGHVLILGRDDYSTDLRDSVAGGDSTAWIYSYIIQELDSKKNVVFEWKADENFSVNDATHEILTASSLDPWHCNAIAIDHDGNLLLSSRHTDEITKINRETGEIIWRMGGKHNQFTFTNDTIPFSHQHDIRRIANGNITMFDNGNFRTNDIPYSRAVEYQVDEVNHTVTKVWQFRHVPDIMTGFMGSVQRLANGNTLVGWGGTSSAAVTEVDNEGTTLYELQLPYGFASYRAFRFENKQSAVPEEPVARNSSNNYPNPFSDYTTIRFTLTHPQSGSVEVFDAIGNRVAVLAQGVLSAGDHVLPFYPKQLGLSEGSFFYRIHSDEVNEQHGMVMVKQ